MSVLGKKWVIRNRESNLSPFEKVLRNRGFIDSENEKFHDPFLFGDMEKAVQRVKKAIDSGERVIIFGDYDVDGITGTAILIHTLKKLGANLSYRIPNRMEDGYALSEKFIDEFIEKDVRLIITVDCGISCFQEVEKAKSHNIDTIITDHHNIPKQLPPAFAIIHPKYDKNYPFDELTGAGVALKLAEALISKFLPQQKDDIIGGLSDLAALGTVADLGPLQGENRHIVKEGLKVLAETKWLGLKKIMELAEVKSEINTVTIGFQIAPRINAAGRIGSPYTALLLLIEENENEKINLLGQKLEKLNNERKNMTQTALDQAEAFFATTSDDPVLIASDPDWHVGILGLVAGKLAEKYNRPAIIMQDFGDVMVASARSPRYCNIIEAITTCGEHLESFGGHAQAAGFSLKKANLSSFTNQIKLYLREKFQEIDPTPILEIDCEISETEINKSFLGEIETLKPFGVGNNSPVFLLNSLEPLYISQVGSQNQHLKFSIKTAFSDVKVIAFNMGAFAESMKEQRKIDLVCSLEKNIWRDKEYLELRALDFRPSNNVK